MFVINNGVQISSRPRTRIAECLGFDYCKSVDLNRADFECDCLFVRWGRPGFISYGDKWTNICSQLYFTMQLWIRQKQVHIPTYNPSTYCWLYISLIFMVSCSWRCYFSFYILLYCFAIFIVYIRINTAAWCFTQIILCK